MNSFLPLYCKHYLKTKNTQEWINYQSDLDHKNMIRYTLLLFLSILLSTSILKAQDNTSIEIVSYKIVKNLDTSSILLDIRTSGEFEKGAINGATHVDFLQPETFTAFVQQLDKSTPVYLYCHSGGRSHQAAVQLQQMGFKKIYDYSGGYADWTIKSPKVD